MTAGNDSGKLDRRIQRTYQQLTDAFMRLMYKNKKDWDQLTVQELCDEAMIRRTTFYQHFRDMRDFFRWRRAERLKDFSAYIADDDPPNDPSEHFLLLSTRLMDYLNQHQQFEKVVMETGNRGQRMLEDFLRLCADEVVARLNIPSDMKPESGPYAIPIQSEFCVGGLLATLRWWYAKGKPCTQEELIHYLRKIVERDRVL